MTCVAGIVFSGPNVRCREIALGLAWNLGARDAGLEARLLRCGIVSIAAATAAEESAPASLRVLAVGPDG